MVMTWCEVCMCVCVCVCMCVCVRETNFSIVSTQDKEKGRVGAGYDLAPKLIAASLMAAPGALVIAKILYPETEECQTMGKVKLEVKSNHVNVIDAISHGASDGFKIAMNVIAMLIGFIALVTMIDWMLIRVGHIFDPSFNLSQCPSPR